MVHAVFTGGPMLYAATVAPLRPSHVPSDHLPHLRQDHLGRLRSARGPAHARRARRPALPRSHRRRRCPLHRIPGPPVHPAVTTGRQAETKPGLRVGRFVIGWSSWSSSSSPSERCGCSEAAAPCWRCRPWSTPPARPGPGGGHPAARRPHHRAGRAPAPDPCSADRLADRLAVRAPPGPRRPSPDTQDDWAGRGASVQSTRDEVGVRSGTNLDPREPPWRRPCGRRSRSPPPPSVSASA